jgi:hypothetical protein
MRHRGVDKVQIVVIVVFGRDLGSIDNGKSWNVRKWSRMPAQVRKQCLDVEENGCIAVVDSAAIRDAEGTAV